MTEEIKTEFEAEVQPTLPAEDTENDNSADSSTVEEEETDTDQAGSSDQDKKQTDNKDGGADKDLDDHPRWQKREEDWTKRFNAQEVRHTEELSGLREDLTGKIDTAISASAPQDVPSWFGGDEQAWNEFTNWNNQKLASAKEEARTEALKEIQGKSEAEQKAINTATQYFNEQVPAIESDKTINPQGEKVDRNKLLKFVLDNDLVDSKGRWNYKAGFIMMRKLPADSKDRKKLASDTTSDKHAETKPPAFMTSDDFSKPGAKPW